MVELPEPDTRPVAGAQEGYVIDARSPRARWPDGLPPDRGRAFRGGRLWQVVELTEATPVTARRASFRHTQSERSPRPPR